jgi:hypothetical protein
MIHSRLSPQLRIVRLLTSASPSRGRALGRLQAFLAHQPAACLEPIAEEIETLSRLAAVAGPCLSGVERRAVGRYPRRDLAKGGLSLVLRPTQDHKVICIAYHPPSAPSGGRAGAVDVGQQRRDHRPSGRSHRRCPTRHVFHNILPEEAFDQRQDRRPVADRLCHQGHQPVVRDASK